MVEYLLLTGVVILAIIGVFTILQQRDYFFTRITSPLYSFLKFNYKYADKDALGWDEAGSGGPRRHIQMSQPNEGQNFKLFLPADR